ncbi:hypothetical protein ABZ942_13420 [Nocardia sp. NPDC046473]|uniref:hypothetical protein n=1 Tax=Nocardia sp. NPDC046473 TaxID=3155733 RepID=UPI0033D3ED17
MTEDGDSPAEPHDAKQAGGGSLYSEVLKAVVVKLRSEEYLFVVAIAVILLVGALGAGTGNVRFGVLTIAVGLLSVFVLVWQLVIRVRRDAVSTPKTLDLSLRTRRLWARMARQPTRVALGRFDEFTDFESGGLVGVGDALALREFSSFFTALQLPEFDVGDDEPRGNEFKANQITLGSADVNRLTEKLAERLHVTIHYDGPRHSRLDEWDDCLIVRAPNPWNKAAWVIIIAGSYGLGTLAGARFVMSDEFAAVVHRVHSDAFECRIEVEIINGSPLAPRVVALQKLR